MTHILGAQSEVGHLQQAIVHRPGLELTRLTPSTWVSVGESDTDWATRGLPYRVRPELTTSSGRTDTMCMHYLPSLHNSENDLGRRLHEQSGLDSAEVSNDGFPSPASVGSDQAENRLRTIRAVFDYALRTSR